MSYDLSHRFAGASHEHAFVRAHTVPAVCSCMMQDMTYVKQLENYEEEVTAKRLGEMPESEREKLMASVEAEKERRQARQQQQSK